MSSPRSQRGTLAAAFAAATMALSLAGCLQPLYAPSAATGDVAGKLAAVKVMPIADRAGHYLANELRFDFNGSGSPVAPRYTLFIGLRENVQSALVDTVTGYPSAGTVVISAEYTLVALEGGAQVAKGTATVASSYDRFAQRYANVRASRDAEIRNARLLAEQIRANVAAALAQKG